MLFDAGMHGMVEVDEIIHKEDCEIGVINPHDQYHKTTYFNYGAQGCSKVVSMPAEDMSPERGRMNYQLLTQACQAIAERLAEEQARATS